MATKTIKVTVGKLTGTQKGFFLDGKPSPRLTLFAGETYFFDQSDPSNTSHPARLSLTGGGTELKTGVTIAKAAPGLSGAGLTLAIPPGTAALHVYCSSHTGMGGSGKLFVASNDNDTLQGTDLADLLNGFGGNDRILGAGGNDTLDGGVGNDSLFGGLGNDRFIGGPGSNTLDGGAGTDLADYSTLATALRLDLAKGTATSTGINDRLISIEKASGGLKNDLLTGNFSANVLAGGVGNDSLYGGGGLDSLDGGPGKDFLSAFSGGASLRGGADNDILEIVSNRFELVSGQFTWDQARRDAESRGGQLATIKDQAEWDTVLRMLGTTEAWLGASDSRMEGTWEWIDGTPFVFVGLLYPWDSGNEPKGGASENHLQFRSGKGWNDANGSNTKSSYLIERNIPETASTAVAVLDGGGGKDLVLGGGAKDSLLGGDGEDTLHGGIGADTIHGGAENDLLTSESSDWRTNRYSAVQSPNGFTFVEALRDAVSRGGHLATIGSAGEWEKIQSVLAPDRAWIGASDAAKEGYWQWIDGPTFHIQEEPPGDIRPFEFWNRDGEEPNDRIGVENHLEIRSDAESRGLRNWNDAKESDRLGSYILEIEDTRGRGSRLFGESGNDTLLGGHASDWLDGGANNDSLLGGLGRDTLRGGGGNDTLTGTANAVYGGLREIDILSGGAGRDLFFLGKPSNAVGDSKFRFYDDQNPETPGLGDYALITDFTVGQDRLALSGAASNYYLGDSGVARVAGIGLFAKQETADELIAIIRSANGTTLTAENTINTGLFV